MRIYTYQGALVKLKRRPAELTDGDIRAIRAKSPALARQAVEAYLQAQRDRPTMTDEQYEANQWRRHAHNQLPLDRRRG